MCNSLVRCQREITAPTGPAETTSNFVTDGYSNLRTENNLKYILPPIVAVLLLGSIISGFFYHRKLKNRRSKFSHVNRNETTINSTINSTLNSTLNSTIISTMNSEDRIPDNTNVPITELWERIKKDDNYKPSNFGTSHQAPLASVLNSQTRQ